MLNCQTILRGKLKPGKREIAGFRFGGELCARCRAKLKRRRKMVVLGFDGDFCRLVGAVIGEMVVGQGLNHLTGLIDVIDHHGFSQFGVI